MSKIVASVAIDAPLRRHFDYLIPPEIPADQCQPGARVWVPFGRQKVVGIIMQVGSKSSLPLHKLKPIETLLDTEALISAHMLKLLNWAAEYYQHPIGEVIACALPKHYREGKERKINPTHEISQASHITADLPKLNADQLNAVEAINQKKGFNTFLLEGVTGSGKTEVYLRAIKHVLDQNKQVLVLVPEISLTPQTVARFTTRFNAPIVVIHSNITEREKLLAWELSESNKAAIVIGTRSAIFTPFTELGMIIIDEEHDTSFKQQSGFRYSARDLAIVRAQMLDIPIILGSATPSLESYYRAQQQRYHHLILPIRAGGANTPTHRIVDLRREKLDQGLSQSLLQAIQLHLEQRGQVLLFLNKRGFAPILLCHHCGWSATCSRCDARMTLHHNPAKLICHHCTRIIPIPTSCSKCQTSAILQLGLGTERIEKALLNYFPNTLISRIDRDTTRRKGKMVELLDQVHSGEPQILIGTQMLAKGHHFSQVTLVGIIDADSGLYCSDFRAIERMGQIITQVAGRSGRAERQGEVIIQTHHPDHPLLSKLISEGYNSFITALLKERAEASWPPYSYLAVIRAEALNEQAPLDFLTEARDIALKLAKQSYQIFGPVPALIARKAGRYRAQLLLQTSQRQSFKKHLPAFLSQLESLKSARKVRWSIDIDPLETL